MKLNKHFLLLIIVLTVIVFIATSFTIFNLYNAAFKQQRAQLTATTQSQAKLIEAVARFDEKFSARDIDGGVHEATLTQIRNANLNVKGFGKSGEFILGKKENSKIVFLLPRRFKGLDEEKGKNKLLNIGGTYAEPIQLALAGKSGTIIAKDYRGELVLAAYAPVKILNYGVVSKIDLKEIRAPFLRVGVMSIVIVIILIIVGALLFVRVTQPIIKGLQDSEEYNRMLFETSPIGLALSSMDGVLVDVNQSYADITGRSIEEIKKLTYFEITPEEYAEDEQRQLESLNTIGRYGPYEKEYLHKDGHRIPVRLLGQVIERNGEKHIWSSVEDISGRKKTEAAFKQSELRLNEAQRLAKVGSWELDLLKGELIWSDEIFNMFEIDKSKFDATYDAFLNAIHPDDRDSVNEAYSNSLVDRQPYEITHRLQMSDGRIKFVHETCESFFDDEYKPIRSVGTVQDITEQQVISQDLEKFKNILDQTLDCVFIFDAEDMRFYYVNEGAMQQIGYSQNELMTMYPYDIKPEVSKAGFIELIKPLVNGEKASLNFETVHQHKNGKLIPVEIFLQYISDEHEHASFVAIVRDITDRKKIEFELDAHREHLEELIEERTKELHETQDELVRKERLATLGQLTATVSHELRNPLGAMRPSLYVIEKKCNQDDDRVRNAIQRIDRNIDRCDRIIDELLDFTRITELSFQPTDIEQWLKLVISEQRIPEGITVEKEFSLNGVILNVDEERLRRAFINVFENGCHSMMDDNQQLVSTERAQISIDTQVNDDRVEIIVRDVGSGMSKEVLEKIYEPLFSTKGFGVGLGMPTVKQIMEQHNGGVEILSDENKGTSVLLWLPIEKLTNS